MHKLASRPCRKLARLSAVATVLSLAGASSALAAPGALQANLASTGGGTRLYGAAAQSDGKTVAVGESGYGANTTLLVARFTSSGALDTSFGGHGAVNGPAVNSGLGNGSRGRAVAIQSDGKIVVVGVGTSPDGSYRGGLLVERFNSNGSVDGSFGSGGVVNLFKNNFGDGYGLAIQPDGKIVATGTVDTQGSGGVAPRVAVVRLNSNGSADGSFGSGGGEVLDFGPYSYALSAALQSDGKIVLVGSQAPGLQVPNALIARLNSNGSPDPSFAGGGAYAHQYARGAANSAFHAVAVQSDGKIVAAGSATDATTGADTIVARFNSNGTADGGFGSGGVVYTPSAQNLGSPDVVPGAEALALAANGTIITGGELISGLRSIATVLAYSPSGALISSFGSGGIVANPASGNNSSAYHGMAITPDGSLNLVGDTSDQFGRTFAGFGARYVGFGPPVVPNPPLQVGLTGLSTRQKGRTVASHGLGMNVACNQACSMRLTLTASGGTARQLKLTTTIRQCKRRHGHRVCKRVKVFRSITVGSARGSLGSAGTKHIVLRLSRAAGRSVPRQRRNVTFSLKIVVTSTATHRTNTITRTITLTR